MSLAAPAVLASLAAPAVLADPAVPGDGPVLSAAGLSAMGRCGASSHTSHSKRILAYVEAELELEDDHHERGLTLAPWDRAYTWENVHAFLCNT